MSYQSFARLLPTHRTTQTQNKCTETYMPWVGFEPTIPVFERAKTVHALDCAATVTGIWTEGLQGKLTYSEETYPNVTSCTTNPAWLDLGKEVHGSNLCQTPSILTGIFCCFPQFLQRNAETIPLLGHTCFLPNPFQFTSHPINKRCAVSMLKASLTNQRKSTLCMYVCIYQGRAANGPSTATIPDLLCFPLYLAPY
jgi:hypothetical protein